MPETFSKVEVITGVARRRRFTTEKKLLVVNETLHVDQLCCATKGLNARLKPSNDSLDLCRHEQAG
jgi:hypothetical protein